MVMPGPWTREGPCNPRGTRTPHLGALRPAHLPLRHGGAPAPEGRARTSRRGAWHSTRAYLSAAPPEDSCR